MANDGVASLAKRGQTACWPHELLFPLDASDPLADVERNELEVTNERVLNFAIVGQIQPVPVRLRGSDLVLVAGRQRWKRAAVINHLVGAHRYTGPLQSVKDAIKRLEGTDAAKTIAANCPKGIKLTIAIHRGNEHEAGRAAISENEQRDADPLATKIRRAQRMSRQGFNADELAADFGVAAGTVKRWLAMDLDKPRTKKKRGKDTRPRPARVARVLDAANGDTGRLSVALGWALGQVSDSDFAKEFPGAKAALEA